MVISYRTCQACPCEHEQEESWPDPWGSSTIRRVSCDMWLVNEKQWLCVLSEFWVPKNCMATYQTKRQQVVSQPEYMAYRAYKLVAQVVALSSYCHCWRRDGRYDQWTGQTDELWFARRVAPRQTTCCRYRLSGELFDTRGLGMLVL
jgi:hypothetical protein